ncbi:FAD:protein FMN transferase, partial [Trichloromonas sp.]|uniref:FAD:protein FMN transferase n=1 Tax=Trichloromonas sp. TaxID=3069249 RepID=UPI003D814109
MPLTRPLAILLLLGLLTLFAAQRCDREQQAVSRSRLLMGTVVEITVFGAGKTSPDAAVSEAFSAMERVEQLMSAQLPHSDISRINASDAAVEVAPETAAV